MMPEGSGELVESENMENKETKTTESTKSGIEAKVHEYVQQAAIDEFDRWVKGEVRAYHFPFRSQNLVFQLAVDRLIWKDDCTLIKDLSAKWALYLFLAVFATKSYNSFLKFILLEGSKRDTRASLEELMQRLDESAQRLHPLVREVLLSDQFGKTEIKSIYLRAKSFVQDAFCSIQKNLHKYPDPDLVDERLCFVIALLQEPYYADADVGELLQYSYLALLGSAGRCLDDALARQSSGKD